MSFTLSPSRPFPVTDGRSIGLFPAPSECTVAQAAEFLRTSERHVNDLLNAGKIAFRREADGRMVQWNSLLDFEQWREQGHAAVDEMVRLNQEMGLYDD